MTILIVQNQFLQIKVCQNYYSPTLIAFSNMRVILLELQALQQ
jgi:hypothetical protein